jgi:hypothetical protein
MTVVLTGQTLFINPVTHEQYAVRLANNQDGTFSPNYRGIIRYIETGSGSVIALSGSVPPDAIYRLAYVALHLSGSVVAGGSAIVSVQPLGVSFYTTIISKQALDGLTDYFFIPSSDLLFGGSDVILFTYTNHNLRSYGAQIVFEPVG